MADSSQITRGLVEYLRGDPALRALMPDGVYLDRSPAGTSKFVIVSLVVGHDVPMFRERAFEEPLYLIKAVELSTAAALNVDAAAARIDTLLDHQLIPMIGYSCKAIIRSEYVQYTEDDDRDPSISWRHAGGRYQVSAAALTD